MNRLPARLENLPGVYHLPDEVMDILREEEFDLQSLSFATKKELVDMGIKLKYAIAITGWQRSLGERERGTMEWLNSLRSKSPKSKTLKSKSKSPNKTKRSPVYRQATISDTLLKELANDHALRQLMDTIMTEYTDGATIRSHQIRLTKYSTLVDKKIVWHSSDLKWHKEALYYNWTTEGGNYCHLSLKDDNAHTNKSGHERDVMGRFHLRWDHKGKHPSRRILVNDNGVIELTQCYMSDQEIDEMTALVLRCIQEYYIQTRGACNIVPGRC